MYIFLLWFLTATIAVSAELPELLKHSENRVVAYVGDDIQLEVVPEKESDQIQWWLGESVLCKTRERCQFSTKDWNPGSYSVVTVVLNEFGSQFVTFQVVLKERTNNAKPGLVTPELIANRFKNTEIDPKKTTAAARKGTGFIWREDKLEIIRSTPRNVDWDEKIKSSRGTLEILDPSGDDFFLLPGSELQLLTVESSKKLVLLKRGRLRVRRSNITTPSEKSVIVADWLQIDGDAVSDYLVEYDQEKRVVWVHVLSGQVLIRKARRGDAESPEDAFSSVAVIGGKQLRVAESDELSRRFKILKMNKIQKLLAVTSPDLLKLREKPKDGRITGIDYDNPLSASRDLLKNHCYSLALHVLSQTPQDLKSDPRWQELAGLSLSGLNLSRLAVKELKKLFETSASGELAFALGLRYFENKNWKKAKQWFRNSLDLDNKENRHLALYYLAVIAFRDKDYPTAIKYFNETKWFTEQEDIMESSDEFLDLVAYYDKWGVKISSLAVYDSNLFKTSEKDNLIFLSDIKSLSGAGYRLKAEIWYYLFHRSSASLGFGFSAKRDGWIKKTLHRLDRVQQQLDMRYILGSNFKFSGKTYLETVILGNQRALDAIGTTNSLTWAESYVQPYLRADLLISKDPLPSVNDILDPYDNELQLAPSDRSSRITSATLGGNLWRLSRQKFGILASATNRVFTNTLLNSENYNRVEFGIEYKARFWGLSSIRSALTSYEKAFDEDDTPYKDQGLQFSFSYGFNMDQGGTFILDFISESQNSDLENRNNKRQVFRTGFSFTL
ncbi:MAG: tetratricopeptide repeat protein [Pseudobacteriovorax sp.]|nr:tetratricopeptide repeat protein [Pseudobacteriovorax sp.]